jgi:hypothetical protein
MRLVVTTDREEHKDLPHKLEIIRLLQHRNQPQILLTTEKQLHPKVE